MSNSCEPTAIEYLCSEAYIAESFRLRAKYYGNAFHHICIQCELHQKRNWALIQNKRDLRRKRGHRQWRDNATAILMRRQINHHWIYQKRIDECWLPLGCGHRSNVIFAVFFSIQPLVYRRACDVCLCRFAFTESADNPIDNGMLGPLATNLCAWSGRQSDTAVAPSMEHKTNECAACYHSWQHHTHAEIGKLLVQFHIVMEYLLAPKQFNLSREDYFEHLMCHNRRLQLPGEVARWHQWGAASVADGLMTLVSVYRFRMVKPAAMTDGNSGRIYRKYRQMCVCERHNFVNNL